MFLYIIMHDWHIYLSWLVHVNIIYLQLKLYLHVFKWGEFSFKSTLHSIADKFIFSLNLLNGWSLIDIRQSSTEDTVTKIIFLS